jgi:hypothetical protein
MRPYLITIRPASRPAWCYRGLFRHSVDALLHGLDTSADPHARISARPIGGGS